jgi:hypothetical protein
MDDSARRGDWLGGGAGIVFVVLFLASPFFGGSSFSGPDQTGRAIAQDLVDNRFEGLSVSIALVSLAAVAGYWFVGAVHQRLNAREPCTAGWVALGGGVATVTTVLMGAGVLGAATTVDSLVGDPQVAKTLWLLELGFFNTLIGPPLIAFIVGISVHAMQHRSLPRWVSWTGLATAAGLAVNVGLGLGGLAAAIGFIWMTVVAVVIGIGPPPAESLDHPAGR